MSTLVAESCTTSLRTARWTVGLGDAAEDQDQFVNLFPALLDDPEVVNNDRAAVMQSALLLLQRPHPPVH